MKTIISLIFLLLSSFLHVNTDNLEISCSSYVVMNAKTREVLACKNSSLQRSVASISKIMTAIVAIESGKIFDEVEISEEDTKMEGSSLYLKSGTTLKVLDLVYGLLLRSGNDAANALKRAVSEYSFIFSMNQKAEELGMTNSIFNNPSGLDIDDLGNISTSLDMAILYSYCLENTLFRAIINTREYRFDSYCWHNKNKLLYRYKYCNGGKTGYTYKAKRTLITSAKKDNFELVVVTLNCGNDFSIHEKLYEKYFNDYSYVEFLEKGYNEINGKSVYSDKNYGVTLRNDEIKDNTYKIYHFDEKDKLLECKLQEENKIVWMEKFDE